MDLAGYEDGLSILTFMYPLSYELASTALKPPCPTHTVLLVQGANPNEMKQIRKILKAQKLYFYLHTSALHRYEVDMTNDGQQSGHHGSGATALGVILLPILRHIIFIFVHS